MKPRVAILISGRGSNMVSLVKAAQAPEFPAEIVLVLSNKPEAAGLEIARGLGVEAMAVPAKPFGKDREAHERAIDAQLRARDVQIICLAGYMRLLTPWLVQRWAGRMLNIHPSLLPKFPGLDTHQRAIEAGEAEHGCTVHLVTEGMDEGPVLGQARVKLLPGDDEAALAARVLEQEHKLYPAMLAELARKISLPTKQG
ncbi:MULTISPECIES: phosphoribosylglycinamide formyltransferase [Acidocella]|uniref:phosphoribosylglycinamide formyltransferase n=1 Tax=Acidocella TaxID=50709 RepID=UPI00028D795C|nr:MULTISPECIES: phosphoribosylglycinamide formyltransferase [Acidocella]EKM99246.1 phosphoribosylglycinamide formyltransferase [Acidocella sp. MX-AZ02]WBO57910.1 phosphoribosylglycinamide formyltransferase [Acidocella sp. MX-AZ03]